MFHWSPLWGSANNNINWHICILLYSCIAISPKKTGKGGGKLSFCSFFSCLHGQLKQFYLSHYVSIIFSGELKNSTFWLLQKLSKWCYIPSVRWQIWCFSACLLHCRLQAKVVGDSHLIRLGTLFRKYELNPNLDVALALFDPTRYHLKWNSWLYY